VGGRGGGMSSMGVIAPEWFWSRPAGAIEREKVRNVKHDRRTSGADRSRATGRG
jgi:hypothetical protein